MSQPSISTIKRLFAESGNECAFDGCTQALVVGETVVGDVCHICAASLGGPRYDPNQSDSDRAAFANLLLMCPTHHRIIDSDPRTYSVAELERLKQLQQARPKPYVISDAIAASALAGSGFVVGTIVDSIVSINQTGGQTAKTINNYGPPKRGISNETRERMISVLRPNKATVGFASTQGDMEADNFKRQLMDVFRAASWNVLDRGTFMFFGSKTGLVATNPFGAPETGPAQTVAHALNLTGETVSGNRGDMANECGVYVQVWHAPH
jgi:hypothetical protein